MRRFLKWVGYIVGGLIVLILIAVGTVYAITSSRLAKTYPAKVPVVSVPTDTASIERGRRLATAVGKCQACHGDNLGGKMMSDDAMFAKLTSSNLTSGQGGIGGTYTDEDWVRAIRYGIGKDNKSLIFMPSEAFYHFSDADLGAIIAYLKSLPPADLTVPKERSPGPIMRIISFIGFPMLPAELVARNTTRPVDVPAGPTREYGEYLTKAGGCLGCHGANLAGGGAMEGVKVPNLTPGGELGKWTEADFVKVIRTGMRPDGRVISAVMPWPYMKELSDEDLKAMWLYIHALPAVTPET